MLMSFFFSGGSEGKSASTSGLFVLLNERAFHSFFKSFEGSPVKPIQKKELQLEVVFKVQAGLSGLCLTKCRPLATKFRAKILGV